MCEPFVDEAEAQDCVLISDVLLHQLLVKARKAAQEEGLPYEENPRMESDAFPYFGMSQQTQSQEPDDRSARVERRHQAQESSNSAPKPSRRSKNKE